MWITEYTDDSINYVKFLRGPKISGYNFPKLFLYYFLDFYDFIVSFFSFPPPSQLQWEENLIAIYFF